MRPYQDPHAHAEAHRPRRQVGMASVILMLVAGTSLPVGAQTTLPVVWTAGGQSSGSNSAGGGARIAADAFGNVAVVSGPSGGRDLAVTSYTADGTFRWRSTVTPALYTYVGDWVVAAPNGDFVAIGHTEDSHGRPVWSTLVRYATDGTLLWKLDVLALASRLLVDAGGNTYLAFSGQDIQLHKYDSSGVLLWAKGSTGIFVIQSAALSPDETDVVLTGDVSGGAIWLTAVYDTTTGVSRWQVTAAEGLAATDVVVDATRVYVTGQGVSPTLTYSLTVVAYDRATGTRLWRTDSNPPGDVSIGLRIALAPDGSVVAAGRAGAYFDWWIVAMNSNGTVRWQARRNRALSGDEIPAAVFVLADGTTVVSGVGGPTTTIFGNQYMQGVTAGYSPSGVELWNGFSALATVWAIPLPNGDVCATGGYDALVTCWRVSGGAANQAPTAVMSATPSTGTAPLTVAFDGSRSSDSDGTIATWAWLFGDGTSGSGPAITHVYSAAGAYRASLTVTDNGGASNTTSATINVTPGVSSVPTAPTNLVASSTSRARINLAWTNTATNATSISVERCRGSACTGFAAVTQLGATATSWTDSVKSGWTYRYRLRASNAAGSSPYSNIARATAR